MFRSYAYSLILSLFQGELIGRNWGLLPRLSLILKVRLGREEKVKEIDQGRMNCAVWVSKHCFR